MPHSPNSASGAAHAPANGTQSIQRAVAILRAIATRGDDGLRLHEIADGLIIERVTAHRIVKGLTFHGMLRFDARTRRYQLGPSVYQLGLSAAPSFHLKEACEPALLHLAKVTGDPVFLMVRSGLDGVCLARIDGSFPIKPHGLKAGTRRPLGAGAGALALLAALPDDEATHAIAANTERMRRYRDLDADRLHVLIAKTRQDGYATNHELLVNGLSAIGMVIPHAGVPYAAVSVASITSRMAGSHFDEVRNALNDTVAVLHRCIAPLPSPWQ